MSNTIQEPTFDLIDPPARVRKWARTTTKINKKLLYRFPLRFKSGERNLKGGDYLYVTAMEFMLSRHGLDDAAENERWKPWNILGQGGYGRVGVWRKVDENGEVLDEVAIKEQNLHKHKHLNKADPLTGLHEEAIIHLALQQKERAGLGDATGNLFVDRDRHILHMRQYKIDKAGKCRMYLDYCPHGTIAALQKDYRIFSKRFPVAFLWHMFHSLALAINVMNGRCLSAAFLYKWRNYQDRAEWPDADHWTIHLDIKDTNIFLCEPDHDNHKASKHDPRMDWPSLKLADFGCAIYTSSADKTNPWVADNGGPGTWDTMPPEQRRWGNDFPDPPNWVGQRWTPTHMVWQVAKIVWDCTFHWPRPKMTNNVMEEVAADPEQYERNGRHWISPTDLDLAPDRNLADLLHRCLHPTALNRPSTDELVKATREGLKSSLKRGDETMLFFRGREIRDMAPGDESFAPITDDYIQVRYRNPEDIVDVPGERWSSMQEKEREKMADYANEASLDVRKDYPRPWTSSKKSTEGSKAKIDSHKKSKKNKKNKKETQRQNPLRLAHTQRDQATDEDASNHVAGSRKRKWDNMGEKEGEFEGNGSGGASDIQQAAIGHDREEDTLVGESRQSYEDGEANDDQQEISTEDQNVAPPATQPVLPLPVTQDYLNRKNDQLLEEMRLRGVALAKGVKKVKASYARALRNADEQGNRGNGARDPPQASGGTTVGARQGAAASAGLRKGRGRSKKST